MSDFVWMLFEKAEVVAKLPGHGTVLCGMAKECKFPASFLGVVVVVF